MRTAMPMIAIALLAAAAADDPASLEWQTPIEVASGQAKVGAWRMNESDWRYMDDPTVAVAPDGSIGVAWVDQAQKDVLYQRYGPDGTPLLRRATNVANSPGIFSWLPRLVMTDDQVFALWQEIVFSGGSHGGEAFFARSTDGGETFGAPVNLSNTTNGAGKGRLTKRYWHNGSLDLGRGNDGSLFAAWTEYQGPLRVARSTDDGGSWSEPVQVTGGEGTLPARGPSLAVRDGRVHLVWAVGEDPAANIRYATSRDGGQTWSEPLLIAASGAHADAPKVAVHSDGTVHLAWMESPDGPLRDYRIRYARGNPFATGSAESATVSLPLPEGFDSAGFPSLELDREGNPSILFELFGKRSRRGTGLALVRSVDGGASFTRPTVIPRGGPNASGVNGSLQGLLMDKLAITPEGGVVVVNSTIDPGEVSQVWLMRTRCETCLRRPRPPRRAGAPGLRTMSPAAKCTGA